MPRRPARPPRQRRAVVRPDGQLRRSQVVGSSGVGALLDLPRHAVIVGGLETWGDPVLMRFDPVEDERSRARLAHQLNRPRLRLYSPPLEGDTFNDQVRPGIVAWAFPRWFVAQVELRTGVRPLVHAHQLVQNKFLDAERKKTPVVPVRFVRACQHGHIDDINWKEFAHRGPTNCARQLLWQERGSSGDFVDIFVACECEQFPPRAIIEATKRVEGKATPVLDWCNGARPWLGYGLDDDDCRNDSGVRTPFKLLVRHASHAYFPQVYRAITVPEPNQTLRHAVAKVADDLDIVTTLEELKFSRRKPRVQAALGMLSDEEVFAEIKRRQQGGAVDKRAPKDAELATFLGVQRQEGDDTPDSLFFAREVELATPRRPLLEPLGKVLCVERLREVCVQVGFTRFEAPSTEIDGELDLGVRSAPLAAEAEWLPAVENKGEGLFISLDPAGVESWMRKEAVKARRQQLADGYEAWADLRQLNAARRRPPPLPYVMLHSLSHLLINALATHSGYSASSIRERIYASDGSKGTKGYGVLLFTGTPDADGTLGGLVEMGRRLEELLRLALEPARLCSNDPICAHHRPDDPHEERFLVGAACHGCLLIPETSCESRNDFLDRALLVPTMSEPGCAFFGEGHFV